MDALIYAIWEVFCYYLGFFFLKVITAGKFKTNDRSTFVSVVGLLLFFVIVAFSSIAWRALDET